MAKQTNFRVDASSSASVFEILIIAESPFSFFYCRFWNDSVFCHQWKLSSAKFGLVQPSQESYKMRVLFLHIAGVIHLMDIDFKIMF